ncbi:GIY-YIG nuclease family protein [Mucilaginibacter glaciei]|uniref:GIY-YIG nuclease family protein n=1 Tax=Mucilaginibacter glaciei TaxID=2772109 RepID=A0A926S3X1_9SPHI|nr:GIY-YIG nuclease family protein [Mucilaginibacter glaciei]MBD1395367.1 GIY-YIG nuclease family protein [Mucilaginibacter glaciei]
MWNYNYFTYILTNLTKNVLYIGVTNDLKRRLYEHKEDKSNGFTAKYHCHYLIHYERFTDIHQAIDREKEIKKWRREKKDALVATQNPEWKFLNEEVNEGI